MKGTADGCADNPRGGGHGSAPGYRLARVGPKRCLRVIKGHGIPSQRGVTTSHIVVTGP